MNISSRQEIILLTLIKEYIKTAQPISSGFLVDKYNLGISSATARNEMAELEELNYIFQPYTSAGRIPTEKAYNFFVEKYLNDSRTKFNKFKTLESFSMNSEEDFKKMAKAIAELSNNAVFWALNKNNLYYTGVSNLFIQPEFKSSDVVYDISVIIDRMEEIISDKFNSFEMGENIFIGSNNPFGNFLSMILLKYKHNNQIGIVGLLGPIRMDYENNISLIKFLKSKLQIK